jgi:hypothetical protein
VNMNARHLEASRRLAKGVDLGAKGEVGTVVLMLSTRIWDLVPVPKRSVFISSYFLAINLTFIYSQPLPVGPYGISTPLLATNISAGSNTKPSSSGPGYSSPGSKQEVERPL